MLSKITTFRVISKANYSFEYVILDRTDWINMDFQI